MLPIIAVIRVDEYDFVYYDLAKETFSEPFTVEGGDGYQLKSYAQITFSTYDEENKKSQDLISVTISQTDTDHDEILKDLPPARLVEIIRHVFTDLNLDKMSDGQVSVLKH